VDDAAGDGVHCSTRSSASMTSRLMFVVVLASAVVGDVEFGEWTAHGHDRDGRPVAINAIVPGDVYTDAMRVRRRAKVRPLTNCCTRRVSSATRTLGRATWTRDGSARPAGRT